MTRKLSTRNVLRKYHATSANAMDFTHSKIQVWNAGRVSLASAAGVAGGGRGAEVRGYLGIIAEL